MAADQQWGHHGRRSAHHHGKGGHDTFELVKVKGHCKQAREGIEAAHKAGNDEADKLGSQMRLLYPDVSHLEKEEDRQLKLASKVQALMLAVSKKVVRHKHLFSAAKGGANATSPVIHEEEKQDEKEDLQVIFQVLAEQ